MNESLIDVNVHLSRWPTRRIAEDETKRLVEKLRSFGVIEAWAGSFDGLLHKDIASVNERLAEECRSVSSMRLHPFGSVNPRLPDWEEDLRRCAEVHRMPGIRLHPNYHGYPLDDPVFEELLRQATHHRLIVALSVQMEDERMMHPLLRVKQVDLKPLAERVAATPGLRLLLLNAGRTLRGDGLGKLLQSGDVSIDIAMLEGLGVLENLLKEVSLDRVLFGSHAPFHYFESGILKLQESSLPRLHLRAICLENARRLLAR